MMFINSIFLPKNLSDQTMPEGITGKIDNFSHLFSNVFRIVKDEQDNSDSLSLAKLDTENVSETQSQLLNISLLSNKKLTLDNQNISSIITAFISKMSPSESKEQSVKTDKSEVKNNISKYFSLNKNDFINEIKSVVDTLKKVDTENLENVSISLIANGHSIQINPLIADSSKLENWVATQLETNNDFEIIVKSGTQKLAVDVEPAKTEFKNFVNNVEIISDNTTIDNYAGVPTVTKNNIGTTWTINANQGNGSEFELQLEEAKTTSANLKTENVKTKNQALQQTAFENNDEMKSTLREKTKLFSKAIEIENHSENKQPQKAQTNNFNITGDKSLIPDSEIKENTLAEIKSEVKIENESAYPVIKKFTNNGKNPESDTKAVSEKIIKSQDVKTDDSVIKDLNVSKSSNSIVKEKSKSENKITVKSNHNLSSVTMDKKALNEKIVFNDLLDKTNVKEIKVQVENPTKPTIALTVKTSNNSVSKSQVQQELFVNTDLPDNENPVIKKTEQIKTANNNQQVTKEENSVVPKKQIVVEKNISVENKNVEIENTKVEIQDKHKENIIDSKRTSSGSEGKSELKQIISKESEIINHDVSEDIIDYKVSKELNQLNSKENTSIKTETTQGNKTVVETEADNTSEKTVNTNKEKTVFENLKTSVKEFANRETKAENVNKVQVKNTDKGQTENQNTKFDFTQRRVYSNIPPLEIFTKQVEEELVKNNILNTEIENTKTVGEPVKSTPNQTELKPKNEKQVWVKVSLEKNDSELLSDAKKSTTQQNKITIDADSDGMKKDFKQNSFSEKESHGSSETKPQLVDTESSMKTETKNVAQNQSTSAQQDLSVNVKPDIKVDHTLFKSALHNEETKFTSRTVEMTEKVKVISSGEMIKEIHKVLESGTKQSIVLKLVPKELGAVKVILDAVNNTLTAKVEVENEAVGHIVRNNIDQLKQNLLQSGVNVHSINISYQNSDQKQNGFNNQKRRNAAYQQNIETEDVDETILAKKMGYNTYEYLA